MRSGGRRAVAAPTSGSGGVAKLEPEMIQRDRRARRPAGAADNQAHLRRLLHLHLHGRPEPDGSPLHWFRVPASAGCGSDASESIRIAFGRVRGPIPPFCHSAALVRRRDIIIIIIICRRALGRPANQVEAGGVARKLIINLTIPCRALPRRLVRLHAHWFAQRALANPSLWRPTYLLLCSG